MTVPDDWLAPPRFSLCVPSVFRHASRCFPVPSKTHHPLVSPLPPRVVPGLLTIAPICPPKPRSVGACASYPASPLLCFWTGPRGAKDDEGCLVGRLLFSAPRPPPLILVVLASFSLRCSSRQPLLKDSVDGGKGFRTGKNKKEGRGTIVWTFCVLPEEGQRDNYRLHIAVVRLLGSWWMAADSLPSSIGTMHLFLHACMLSGICALLSQEMPRIR